MSNYLLKLYVTGQTPRSRRAIDNLRRICEDELRDQYEMHVIDVLERPQGNCIIIGNLGEIGKNVSEVTFSEIPRKQGVFEIRPYNRLIVVSNIGFSDMPMSLEKSLEN